MGERAPTLTPSGRRPPSTRRRTKRKARRRKRNLSSTFKEPTDRRRSQILTSPSLMRAVVAVEDAVVDADVVVVAVVMDLLAIVRTVDPGSVETVRPAVDVEMDPAVEAVEDLVV